MQMSYVHPVCALHQSPHECVCPTHQPPTSRGNDALGWLGALVLWFIVLTVLFWLIYFSLKPNFVVDKTTGNVDTSKILLAAVITALILVVIIWIIRLVAFRG